jgi:receptor protein-tyrosine kinase
MSGLVVGGGIALASSAATTPLYSSQTQLFVSTTDSATTADVFQGSQFSQQRVASYARLLRGDELASRVIDRLRLDTSTRQLTERITVTAVPDTVLLDITVSDPSPRQAQQVAQAIGAEFPRMVDELETPDASGASLVRVTVTDSPDLPVAVSEPKMLRNAAVGMLVGLFVGVGAAVVRVRMDRSVKEPAEASDLAGAPVIGTVIRDDQLASSHVMNRAAPTRAAEDYRQLRTNLQFLNVDDPPKVIMVSSAMPAEGKTTVTINLALALAEAGRQVTVLDADLRRPRVTNYLSMVGGVGLTNILAGTAELTDVLQTYGDSGVSVIGAGPTPPNPSELLASKHMFTLIDELRGKSEYVLIDAPPLLPVADSTGLAVMVDGVLLSVRYGQSRKDQLQQAAATLDRVGARTLGLILNIVPPKASVTAGYGYGYTYGDDKGADGKKRHRS